jgi:hypothetical protein
VLPSFGGYIRHHRHLTITPRSRPCRSSCTEMHRLLPTEALICPLSALGEPKQTGNCDHCTRFTSSSLFPRIRLLLVASSFAMMRFLCMQVCSMQHAVHPRSKHQPTTYACTIDKNRHKYSLGLQNIIPTKYIQPSLCNVFSLRFVFPLSPLSLFVSFIFMPFRSASCLPFAFFSYIHFTSIKARAVALILRSIAVARPVHLQKHHRRSPLTILSTRQTAMCRGRS